jgi:nicotinamidase-related amidase
MVLLTVDAQKAIVNEGLYQHDLFMSRVQELIAHARSCGVEVIHVRHDDGPGHELTPGNPGYEIHEAFRPLENELIFDKQSNSAFRGTGLLEHLRNRQEDTVIIAGLQTDYCIDATIKAGYEHGLRMIVPAHANTTFANPFMEAEAAYRYHNEFMWPRRYANCIPFEEALALMSQA